ncbi:hypothetical protein EIP86_001472 [Pleurotus ostreatoroseus]|nr:hypothetical protein EIP86_001472 [Pleurotus ostreatoroseus]
MLVASILENPGQWNVHIERSIASTILAIIYDWPRDDPRTEAVIERVYDIAHRQASAAIPGNYLVEIFPSMIHLPEWLAKWKREGRAWFKKDSEMFVGMMKNVEDKINTSVVDSCLAADLIHGRAKHDLNETQTAWLAGLMFLAGSETTSSTVSTALMAFVLHPEVVRKAQAQLDVVVGRDRLPTFNDRMQLPYIEAIVKEVLRWRPSAPIGVPRRASQDDWYKGYFIPKGESSVEAIIRSINRDPKFFPYDADTFRPERYLNEDGELEDILPDSHGYGHLSFGSGRRICAGKDLAVQMLFISLATILWAFDIEKAVDARGDPITPLHGDPDLVDNGIVVYVEPSSS